MKTTTKQVMEAFGNLCFWIFFCGLPTLPFMIYYQGRSMGCWFCGIELYEALFRVFSILVCCITYCLVMFGIRMTVFEPLWFKYCRWYEQKRDGLPSKPGAQDDGKAKDLKTTPKRDTQDDVDIQTR